MNNWIDDIVDSLSSLGGLSHYSELYDKISEIREGNLPDSWKAIIRRNIQYHSSDSNAFRGKLDLFYSVEGIGSGVWGLRDYKAQNHNVDLTEDDISFPEGKKVLRQHILRERNPKVTIEAKKRFIQVHGRLFCEACGFDFEKKYGSLGKDFIEGHHTIPISQMETGDMTKIEDIVMLCSNCHKMIHRKRPWLTKEEIKNLING